MGIIFHFKKNTLIETALLAIIFFSVNTGNIVSAKTIFCPNAPPSHGFLVCNGTNSADNMVGTPSQDLMNGYGGNDKIVGKAGFDDIQGGSGNDTIIVTNTGNINCGTGYDIANILSEVESGAIDDNCEVILVGH